MSLFNHRLLIKKIKQARLRSASKPVLVSLCLVLAFYSTYAQPANDNCAAPEIINISNGGYGTGAFTSSNVSITQATIQPGETFAPAILVAGQNQKTIWFKFTLGTTRKIRVTLQQPGAVIQAGDAGFAVYKTNTCLPGNAALSTQLTPIATFGNTFHPCVTAGEYLVQVSSKSTTAGSLSVEIESDFTGAPYDRPSTAYNFGTFTTPTKYIDFPVECQSLEDATEMCTNSQQFTKSTWHTFTTPAYFDFLSVLLASPTGSFAGGQQTIGYRLYKGDARTVAIPALVPVGNCDSFSTSGYTPDYRTYKCGQLDNSTVYSIQLFYRQNFAQDIRLAVAYGGTAPTKAPEPILNALGTNQLGTLAPSGATYNYTDYLACNSRHTIHPCGDALPANGVLYNGSRFNLSTFYSFTLTASSNVAINAYAGSCSIPNLLIRLYRQGMDNSCATLVNANLANAATNNLNQECLLPGTYTIQISGQDGVFTSNNYNIYYNSLANSSQLCMFANLGQTVNVGIRVTAANALNQFSLNVNGAFDKINNLAVLQNGITYAAAPDVFGCAPTVLPDTLCPNIVGYNKAMYRQFAVADSGTVTFTKKNQNFYYKLFRGDADALATQQNRHAFPQRITGMTPMSECLTYFYSTNDELCRPDKVCVLPGTYTFTTLGSATNYIGVQDKPEIKFDTHLSKHGSPITAQNMGSLLDSSLAARTSDRDYFSCTNNAVPINGYLPCMIVYNNQPATKAIYRQFYLREESIVSISSSYDCFYYNYGNSPANKTLFSGKATDGLTGLQPLPAPWRCFSSTPSGTCRTLPAGWYTVVSYGVGPSYQNPLQNLRNFSYAGMVGAFDQFTVTITPSCPASNFNRPYKASVDPATLQPYVVDWPARFVNVPVVNLSPERFNCTVDTPFVTRITPCGPAYNRASYYVFRVVRPTSLAVTNVVSGSLPFSIYPLDVRTDSALFATTTPVITCANMYSNQQVCNLQTGVYTLVIFASDAQNCTNINPILTKLCNEPYYNRPYKAAVDAATGQPFLIDYGPGTSHTAAYPKTDVTYTLPIEYFDCRTDLPFSSHPIVPCNSSVNKVAYYVFKTIRESYVQINTRGLLGTVYPLNVKTDSALMPTTTPVQPCVQSSGYIQLCRLPAGTYTLVIFSNNSSYCSNVTPTIYIDQPGFSRFDRAAKAYDFGTVPPDNAWHNGRTGDTNPLDAARAPSNDFFYCTTGSSPLDPTDGVCYSLYNPRVYGDTSRYLFNSSSALRTVRRNLWYTFVTGQGGTVKVKVENKTINKLQPQYRFTVYKSNVNGTLPFSTVVSTGQVDSTNGQGLTPIVNNQQPGGYYCYNAISEVSFYRPPCNATPERYYVLVESPSGDDYYGSDPGMQPNSQAEVSVQVNPVTTTPTLFDHYSQAGNMGTLGAGTHTGPTDNFNCATRDATDPLYDPNFPANPLSTCTKNIWYKFTVTVSGSILFRMVTNGATSNYDYSNIQLFRQTIPGDSTAAGLKYQPGAYIFDGGFAWSQTCVVPGTYYLLLPGCNRVSETVFPQLKITEQAGDFCSSPVMATLGGAGMATATAIVNCHTIGTDYGEFNPQLTCPALTATNTYKSSWFRVDVTGNDTLDVTAFLVENTSAPASQIKYRIMTGNCGAMQEQSCVQDALTQNTYKCLGPGSYFFQVFTPVGATGDIQLKLNAVPHADTCAPFANCLSNANFIPQFDCNTSDSARFVNYSTYGNAIQYAWNFGYSGQTSTAVSPSFFYPALPTSQTYSVTLTTRNTSCNGQNSVTIPINIPARPYVNLGNDTALCNGGSLVLSAASHPGATYQWSTGATTPTITVNTTSGGVATYWARVTFGGCTRRDTIKVFINPITGRSQNKVFCTNDSVQLSSVRNFSGVTYLWSTGAVAPVIYASTPGTYYCDIKLNGCVKRDTFNVTAAADFSFGNDTAVCIRPGQPYVLSAATAGAISYLWQNNSTAATFNVTAAGQYSVRINFGSCIIQDTINLTNLQPVERTIAASLCAGFTYTLPGGTVVSTAGIYKDTTRTSTGCDSAITTTTLILKTVSQQNMNASICLGQSYTLPWGAAASTAGNYRDTLRSPTDGCDSVIRTVTLAVVSPAFATVAGSICQGQSYTLPSGALVTTAGTYRDTLHYVSGCDSLIITLNLTLKTVQNVTRNSSICIGQNYMLPGGMVVSTPGVYYDTLRYVSGCDSVRYTTNLSIGVIAAATINAGICNGITYTLPSGTIVTAAGIYRDTLRHITGGCDSIHYMVNVTVRPITTATTSAAFCAGQPYILPSGTVISAAGIYRDTLRYANGCDSLVNTFTITTRNVVNRSLAAFVCAGQSYTLPSGTVVSSAGSYRDTLRYAAGCDSIINTIILQQKAVVAAVLNPAICAGQSYTLPSGTIVNTPGTYRDTLRYSGGCDSVRMTINLTVMPKPVMGVNPAMANVCEGDSVQLKAYGGTTYRWVQGSGVISPTAETTWVYPAVAGSYKVVISEPVCNSADTFQSIVRVNPLPVISITKSNDVTCIQGAAQLVARGGSRYRWSPTIGLNNATIPNPVASPSVATMYYVQVISDRNCVAEDSMEVKVLRGDAGQGFLVPTAFSPNGDGNNDCFGIRSWGAVTDLRFTIYDRWGTLVFSTTDPSKCWDGRYKGSLLPPAGFVYFITANTVCGPVQRKGAVLLVR